MTRLFGYTILTNQEYYEQQAELLDLHDKVRRLADLEAARCEELDALKVALEYHNEDFKNAVSDSSFYREQYARALQLIKSLGVIAIKSVDKLAEVEDEYLDD